MTVSRAVPSPADDPVPDDRAVHETFEVEPPYDISMTCTICHAAPNPLVPAANVNQSSWKNIVFALGNQYFGA